MVILPIEVVMEQIKETQINSYRHDILQNLALYHDAGIDLLYPDSQIRYRLHNLVKRTFFDLSPNGLEIITKWLRDSNNFEILIEQITTEYVKNVRHQCNVLLETLP